MKLLRGKKPGVERVHHLIKYVSLVNTRLSANISKIPRKLDRNLFYILYAAEAPAVKPVTKSDKIIETREGEPEAKREE